MTIKNVSSRALGVVADLLSDFECEPAGPWVTSVAQNSEGSLFIVAATSWGNPVRIRWALVQPDGRRTSTIWCDESALREACRIGTWSWPALRDDESLHDIAPMRGVQHLVSAS